MKLGFHQSNYKVKTCMVCGKEYQSFSNRQKYCVECALVVIAKSDRVYATKHYWANLNPEKNRAAATKWRREHPEQNRANGVAWARKNREKRDVHNGTRRALKYGNTPISEMLTSVEWIAILAEANGHCAYCGKEARLTLDHVIPLSKGGKHSKENVVAACLHCNCSKSALTPQEWRERLQINLSIVENPARGPTVQSVAGRSSRGQGGNCYWVDTAGLLDIMNMAASAE